MAYHQVAGANRRWRCPFRYRGSRRESAVLSFFSLADSRDMKSHYAKCVRVALLYGSACFLVFWGLSIVGWWLFPNYPKDDELMHQMRWLGHTVGEKIASMALLSVTAFLASRAHHPSGKWGVATGIAAAVAFQLVGALVYIVRFGLAAYREYNATFYTMLWTVLLGWVFGYLAVRRQYLHEKHAV